ncbi:disintegrin and metalloproteinase domain-containing protein 19 [Microcaecilia unicolor]|uniref:Disintegrin and metalloproteinase domain-containing protein 19 n=1 Tax=Microcaecilia unicolor TaxID=1415580 RepID=A0A6P7YZQ2_9AMPH|nr:disintegrin and metalloproteinase domain-containing protein 19 [Microcaecilia unicolor]
MRCAAEASAGAGRPLLWALQIDLWWPLLLLLGKMLLLDQPGYTQAGGPSDADHVSEYEVTIPRWLGTGTSRNSAHYKHPLRAQVQVTAEGRDIILDLEKNEQLQSPDYTETYYTHTGIPNVVTLNHTDHCYYHGSVRGLQHSSVVLSTCRGIRGMILLTKNLSYIIEPVPGSQTEHRIYRTKHLKLQGGTCGHEHAEAPSPDWATSFVSSMDSGHHRVKREDFQSMKYVELFLVADYTEFQKHNYDYERMKHKMVEVANYIDKFYRSLNIRIALVGLEVWTNGDQCEVSENPYSTLWSFLAWKRKLFTHRKHDNAQLITGKTFLGTTIGLAPLMAMCSVYQSGGVNMDHSNNAIGIAATMAHEMGHNFGMSHDSAGCCTASPEDGGCIMAAATGHPFPKVFNTCNMKELDRFLQTGGGMCLSNMPDTKTLYGGHRCGNGYLEEGEECDCGEVEECNNPCCNARNCILKPGADCAHGICCHQCKLKPPGVLCRKQSRPCDLPEFCTGKSPFCPSNYYKLDGTACQDGEAYCYSGMCLTYEQQCFQLWGAGAKPAPALCYEKVNAAGDKYGNCGKDLNGKYRACDIRDSKCGKIQCQSPASKPLESNAVPIDTTITVKGKQIKCRGMHVYRTAEEEGDMLDPGLVLTGTKCEAHHICFEGRCTNASFFKAEECTKKCNGHGICNNNNNCHCFQGWDPPFCNTSGNGGSIDSGPLPTESSKLVRIVIPVLLLVLFGIGIVICYCFYRKRYRSTPDTNGIGGQTNIIFKLITQLKGKTPRKISEPTAINRQHPSTPQAAHGPLTCRANHQAGPVRQPPPNRPAPLLPAYPAKDLHRPQPPQKALPAVPGAGPDGTRTLRRALLPPAGERDLTLLQPSARILEEVETSADNRKKIRMAESAQLIK